MVRGLCPYPPPLSPQHKLLSARDSLYIPREVVASRKNGNTVKRESPRGRRTRLREKVPKSIFIFSQAHPARENANRAYTCLSFLGQLNFHSHVILAAERNKTRARLLAVSQRDANM